MYAKYIKRIIDFILSVLALIVLFPLLLVLCIIGAIAMQGNPFFTQLRPGKDEKIFKMVKFRTMTNKTDKDGNLLPDDKRLTKYGKFLRSTSLDELPELFNIIKGDMAVVGPRPQLVRDMVFMSDKQRLRHTVRPGLTGLAQVSGRNALRWENKLSIDLEYIENITFFGDIKIILTTFVKVCQREDISDVGMETAEDYGDYLLRVGKINEDTYKTNIDFAKELISKV